MNLLIIFTTLVPLQLGYGFQLPGSKEQTVSVTGKLLCYGYPAAGITLHVEDTSMLRLSSNFATAKTNASGVFDLTASKVKLFQLHAQLSFKHHCNVEEIYKGKCYTKRIIKIPDIKIERKEKHDIGTIELSEKVSGAKVVCRK